MNKTVCFLFVLLSLGVFSGCASLDGGGNTAVAEPDAAAVSRPGENLVCAIVKNDPSAFLKELPGKLIQEFGEKDFEKTRASMVKELGEPVSYSFLRKMEHPVANVALWVIRFERTPADPAVKTKNGKAAIEVLFRVVYGKIDGKDTLLSFNFY